MFPENVPGEVQFTHANLSSKSFPGGSSQQNMSDTEKGGEVSPSESEDESKDIRTITGFRWFLFITSTLTAIFVYALDNTIVANIVPVCPDNL